MRRKKGEGIIILRGRYADEGRKKKG